MTLTLYHDKFLDWSKLKAFADDKINVTEKQKFFMQSIENIVGKGLVTSIFSFSHNVFERFLSHGR